MRSLAISEGLSPCGPRPPCGDIRPISPQVHLPLCMNQESPLVMRELARRKSIEISPSHIHLVLRLQGDLDVGVLESAINHIVRRHPGLRLAIFPNLGISRQERESRLRAAARTGICQPGLYLQSVERAANVSLRASDFSGTGEVESALSRILEEDGTQIFDAPPRIRASLLKFSKSEHLLVLTIDHIAADGWSLQIIRKELEILYAQSLSGGSPSITMPSISFPDFAVWQNSAANTGYFDRHVRYWRGKWSRFGAYRLSFDDIPFTLPSKQRGFDFRSLRMYFESRLSLTIRAFARTRRLSIHMIFLAAYVLLLHQYTGRRAVTVWGHFSNRRRSETQDVIGYFANTHILGFDLSSDPTGSDLLNQARSVVSEAADHEEMPLPYLWRTLRCHPLMLDPSVLIDFRTATKASRVDTGIEAGLRITEVPLPNISSPRSASLGTYVTDHGDRLSVRVQYATDRFPRTAIKHMLEDLQAILVRIIEEPTSKASGFRHVVGRYSVSARAPDSSMSEFVVVGSELIPESSCEGRNSDMSQLQGQLGVPSVSPNRLPVS